MEKATKTPSLTTKLKISRNSLAYESRYIRHLEHRLVKKARRAHDRQKGAEVLERITGTMFGLHRHRTVTVRRKARILHIVNAFLRGVPYVKVEQKVNLNSFSEYKPRKFWEEVIHEAWLYSNNNTGQLRERIIAWRDAHPAKEVFNGGSIFTDDVKKYGDVWFHLKEGT